VKPGLQVATLVKYWSSRSLSLEPDSLELFGAVVAKSSTLLPFFQIVEPSCTSWAVPWTNIFAVQGSHAPLGRVLNSAAGVRQAARRDADMRDLGPGCGQVRIRSAATWSSETLSGKSRCGVWGGRQEPFSPACRHPPPGCDTPLKTVISRL